MFTCPLKYFNQSATEAAQLKSLFRFTLLVFSRDLTKYSGELFRLDGDEGVVGLSTHLTNLSRLMENSQDR